MFQPRRAILLSVLVLLPLPAPAADFHWTGTTSTDWTDPSNWLELQPPGPTDAAYVPDPNPATLSSPTTLADLSLYADVPNPYVPFIALTATSTSLTVTNSLTIGPHTALSANGTLSVASLDNQGTLAVEPGTLTLTAPPGHPLDLDGAGDHDGTGVIVLGNMHTSDTDYLQRTLVIDAPLDSPFNGKLYGTGTVTFTHPWTAGPNSVVGLHSDSRYVGILAGAPVTIEGLLTSNYGYEDVSAPVTLTPSAHVTINFGSLRLQHPTFAGAPVDMNGPGRLYLSNGADVTADTTFNYVSVVGSLTVHPGVTLTLNDLQNPLFLPSEYGKYGSSILILLQNSTAQFNFTGSTYFQWVPNAVVLHDGALLSGSPIGRFFDSAWPVSVLDGVATISNDLSLHTPTMHIASGAELRLDGNVSLSSDPYAYSPTLSGTIRFRGTLTAGVPDPVLNIPAVDLDGVDSHPAVVTIPENRSLTLNTNTLDPDDDNSFDGTLHDHNLLTVNTPIPWTAGPASTLELLGSHGYLSPRPTIAGSPLRARGLITSDAWQSQITSPLTADGATLNVTFGTLYLPAPLSISSSLTKTGPATLSITGPQSHSPGAVLRNTAGTLELHTDAGSPTGRTLSLQTTGDSRTYLSGDQHFASLQLSGTSLVTPDPYNLWPPTLLVTDTLAIDDAAALNLQRSTLLILNSQAPGFSPGSIRSYLTSGYHHGAWDGPGIRSSFTASDPPRLTSIGYAEAADLGLASFQGEPLDPTSLLIRTTWAADANLDNLVEADDLARLDYGYAHHLTGWSNGDFNYDDTIDLADYLIYYRTYILMGRNLPPDYYTQLESRFGPAFVSSLLTSIPEPSPLFTACGLAFLPLLTRHRHTV